jgi:hypothetical protein
MLKKDNWPTGTPIRITTEAVGIEAAEQVRDWLQVKESALIRDSSAAQIVKRRSKSLSILLSSTSVSPAIPTRKCAGISKKTSGTTDVFVFLT